MAAAQLLHNKATPTQHINAFTPIYHLLKFSYRYKIDCRIPKYLRIATSTSPFCSKPPSLYQTQFLPQPQSQPSLKCSADRSDRRYWTCCQEFSEYLQHCLPLCTVITAVAHSSIGYGELLWQQIFRPNILKNGELLRSETVPTPFTVCTYFSYEQLLTDCGAICPMLHPL